MNVAGNAGPHLLDVALPLQALHLKTQVPVAEITGHPRHGDRHRQTQPRQKPPGFPEMRQHLQPEGGPSFIPKTVVIAGHDAEAIGPRFKIVVLNPAPVASINPIGIKSLQPVAKADFAGIDERKGGVAELEILMAGRDFYRRAVVPARRKPLADSIHRTFFNHHRRRPGVDGHPGGLHADDALRGGKP